MVKTWSPGAAIWHDNTSIGFGVNLSVARRFSSPTLAFNRNNKKAGGER